MGNDTINQAAGGTVIPSSEHNSIRGALSVDHVPRNSSGVVTDQAGSVGSTTYTWLKSYIRKMFIGAPTSLNSIEEDGSNDIIVKRNNTEVGKFTSDGYVRSHLSPANYVQSSSSGSVDLTGYTSFTDIPNLSINITTIGNPVMLYFMPVGSASRYDMRVGSASPTQTVQFQIGFYRDTTTLANTLYFDYTSMQEITDAIQVNESKTLMFMDTPSAGTYTYKVKALVLNGSGANNADLVNYRLIAIELG